MERSPEICLVMTTKRGGDVAVHGVAVNSLVAGNHGIKGSDNVAVDKAWIRRGVESDAMNDIVTRHD